MWTLADDRSVYIEQDPDRAGQGLVTVLVEDLDVQLAEIAARGLAADELQTYSNGVRKAVFRDTDGNEVGFGGAPVGADHA